MYVLIKEGIIQSYSKTEMEGGIYTSTLGLCAGMQVDDIKGDEILASKSHIQLVEEKQKIQNHLLKITDDLVNINGKIEGAKKLKEMGIFDEDDELELVGYETKAQELIALRAEIKKKIKELD